MKKLKSKKGYSLIEMVITVAVIGIMATIAVPSFKELIERQRFDRDVRFFSTEIALTRLNSISKNRQYRLQIDQANEAYFIYQGNASSSSTSWTFKKQFNLDAGSDIYQVDYFLASDIAVFNPDGTMTHDTTDDSGFIYLKRDDGSTLKRIIIHGVTGRITVERWVGGIWKDERDI